MKGDIIPDGEILYKYVKPSSLPADQNDIPVFLFEQYDLSCDWSKYQFEPEKSFHIEEGKNLILKINVCLEIKKPLNPRKANQPQPAWEQEVLHDPIEKGEDKNHPDIENFSHSVIRGLKRLHVTSAIQKNSSIYKIVPI